MLKQRLITIAILLPLFIWCVFALPTRYFALITAIVMLVGAWEWGRLMNLASDFQRLVWLLIVVAAMTLSLWLITFPEARQVILVAAALWWFIAMLWIRRVELDPEGLPLVTFSFGDNRFPTHLLFGMLGIITLVPAWLALVIIHGSALSGEFFVMLLMLLVWGADSGAYVAGRLWGERRLAPQVSPGKTWEGVYGALAAAIAVSLAGGWWMGFNWTNIVTLTLLGLITVLFSIVGDLFESLLKRFAGVKDSGQLLPGHGGMLDRIDSVSAAAPIFVLGLLWQGVVP